MFRLYDIVKHKSTGTIGIVLCRHELMGSEGHGLGTFVCWLSVTTPEPSRTDYASSGGWQNKYADGSASEAWLKSFHDVKILKTGLIKEGDRYNWYDQDQAEHELELVIRKYNRSMAWLKSLINIYRLS